MAGLNFQTTTIINGDKDSSGKNLFEVVDNVLRIKRDFTFEKEGIKSISKAVGDPGELCEVTVDLANAVIPENETEAYYRLEIYLGVEGAEPFIYSNPWIQKGIPFWVEFTVTDANKEKIAEHVVNLIKQNNLFLIDKNLIEVEGAGTVITLKGTGEYQRFRKVELYSIDILTDYAKKQAELGGTDIEEVKKGKSAFGTYSHLIKDLRLPTAENLRWNHLHQSETPVVNAIYNQYIIEYKAPASNEGLQAVGQRLESHTTHVFWVKRDSAATEGALVTAWEAELKKVGFDTTTAEQISNDGDDAPEIFVNELND